MKIYKEIPVAILLGLICFAALILIGCDIAPVPGKFTYIVEYEVTSATVADATATYDNGAGVNQGGALVTLPWSSDDLSSPDFTFNYDYNNQFNPKLVVDASLNPGESITFSILWKDYKVDFQEEVLETLTITNTTAAVLPVTGETLYTTPLPK
jgi:hypothetical protein